MNPIDTLFRRLKSEGRKAFIPFITAGDPDLATTEELVTDLARRGASLVEIGFPYSDPIADGAVIQASYTRALEHRVRVDDIYASVKKLAEAPILRDRAVPLVSMVSYSLVLRRGPEKFLKQAKDAGLSGAIIPDLPVEESTNLIRFARELDFKLVHLVTPTTPSERAIRIASSSTGFLYCVSVTGITGERDRLPEELLAQLTWLRQQTELPLCAGFGISRPEHILMLRNFVDGIIVGSALVRRLEHIGNCSRNAILKEIGDLAQSFMEALAN